MKQGSDIDWISFDTAGETGKLLELLSRLPREHWTERDELEYTLLHYACRGPNVAALVALLQSGLVDVDELANWRSTAAHEAAVYSQPRVLEVLCAAGADLQVICSNDRTALDFALESLIPGETVRVLVANGVRLSTASDYHRRLITPEMEKFEQGVLHCRKAVIAMLRLKKAAQLWHMDRFLIREIGFAIWTTRYDTIWQNETGVVY